MFKITSTSLVPNKRILDVLDINKLGYMVLQGKIRLIEDTNLKIVIPTTYLITSPFNLEILEYELTEKNNKPIFIKSLNQKFNIKELTNLLKKLKKSI